MTTLAVAGIVVALAWLLFAIGSLVGRLLAYAASGYPELEPVRCTCRRHGWPSPLCPVHGGKA